MTFMTNERIQHTNQTDFCADSERAKGEALPWYLSLPVQAKNHWPTFQVAFLEEFRPIGALELAMKRLTNIRYKRGTNFWKFKQKFQKLVRRKGTGVNDGMQKQWLLNELPHKMSFAMRKENPPSLAAANHMVHQFINADITSKNRFSESEEFSSSKDEGKKKKSQKKGPRSINWTAVMKVVNTIVRVLVMRSLPRRNGVGNLEIREVSLRKPSISNYKRWLLR